MTVPPIDVLRRYPAHDYTLLSALETRARVLPDKVLVEFRDDELRVFYILEIVNTARARVDIGGPLILDLPADAEQATVLEGSTTAASVGVNTPPGAFAARVADTASNLPIPSAAAAAIEPPTAMVRSASMPLPAESGAIATVDADTRTALASVMCG